MRCALHIGVCAAAMLAAPFAAGAADVAIVPPVSQAPLSWTGFYAGVHLASGWANPTWQSGTGQAGLQGLVPFPGGASGNGAVGGGQVGWNYQAGPWVLGVEAAISAADINAVTACAAGAFICSVNVDGLGTATGRLGFAFDQFLVYGKAGAAVEHSRDAMVLRPFTAFSFNGSATRSGWTAGTGVEFAFNPALSAFAEYDFLDFGTRGIAMINSTGVGARVALSEHVHLVKVGLNYKLGQNLSSWTAAARALPLFPVPPASLNWTGVYIGGHVGGGWGQTNWNSATGVLGNGTTVFAGSGTDNGFAIGGQVGVNYQVGPWVMGFEADADWSDLDGNAPCAASAASASGFTCHTHINGFGTLAGRLGQAFGNLLVYGKGGAAWDSESHFALDSNLAPNAFAANDTRWGWAIGAGLEYAFTPAWSGKVEYDYLSFANRAVAFSDGAGNVSNVGLSQSINVVKMGFNYKLGADPASPAYAAAAVPMWVKAPVFKAPPPSDWTIEAGARYWVSSGRKQLDLAANQADVLLSRLTYDSVAGQAAEAFARLDHRDGMFLKGNFGLGDLQGGRFYDEDIRPAVVPYSDTISSQRDGRTLYGSLDVGHTLIRGASGDIGAYVGYRYLYERDNAFGFRQLATNEIVNLPFLSSDVLGITETEAWNGLAVGLNTRFRPADRWQIEVDAALLPFLGVWGSDNHWLRVDINPLPAQGQGWGSQFEAILSYAITDQWSIGAGARYWYFATSNASSVTQPIKLYSERYGGFVQTTYKFGGPTSASSSAVALYNAPPAPVTWTGFYAGASLGAGFGRSNWSDPFGPTSIGDQDRVGGALVGGQVGANYQIGSIVYGIEAAGSWAPLTGTASCFAGNPNQAIAGQDCGTRVGALAFLTPRIGYALDRTLYYAKAGPAFGHTTFDLNSGGAAPGQVTAAESDRWGWTIGGGVEHALTREWSVVGEYKYVDLGTANVSFAGVPATIAPVAREAINQRYQLVTLGLNYKLN